MFMGEPWHRLAVILLSVALLTALAALPLLRESARQRYHKGDTSARTQLAALLLCLGLLLPVWLMKPQLLVVERFFPQWGSLQLALASIWAACAAGWLSGKKVPQVRMRLWRLFSLVFFTQLVLGLALESRFLLSGQLHLPVPGLIAAAPIYRGGGWFMAALVGPDVFFYEGHFNAGPSNLFLMVALPSLLVAWWSKNYFLTIAFGIGLVILARWTGLY